MRGREVFWKRVGWVWPVIFFSFFLLLNFFFSIIFFIRKEIDSERKNVFKSEDSQIAAAFSIFLFLRLRQDASKPSSFVYAHYFQFPHLSILEIIQKIWIFEKNWTWQGRG